MSRDCPCCAAKINEFLSRERIKQNTKENKIMSRKALPNPGTYLARRHAQTVTRDADSGALCVYIPVVLLNSEVQWQGKAIITIGKSDGTLQTKQIKSLNKSFPAWNPAENIFGIDDLPLIEDTNAAEFEVVGEIESFTPRPTEDEPNPEPIEVFKIQWVNPIGGSTNMPEPTADRKALAAKWGSKMKASFGGKTVAPAKTATATPAATKAAAPAKTAAPAKAAAGGPPGRKTGSQTSVTPRTSSQEEVWSALRASVSADEVPDDALAEKYYAALEAVREGFSQSCEGSPQDWGKVLEQLGL